MSQVLANPKSSDPPENNDPLKVETSKLISRFEKKKMDMIDTLNKLNAILIRSSLIMIIILTFLFITLKEQDSPYLFSKSIPFTFFVILFFEVPMWSTHF